MPIARIPRGLAAAFAACVAIAASGVAAAQSVKDYEVNTWFGFVAPARTPPEVIARLNTEFNRIFASAEANQKLGPQGFDLAPPTAPTAFAKLISDDLAIWVPIVKASGAAAN